MVDSSEQKPERAALLSFYESRITNPESHRRIYFAFPWFATAAIFAAIASASPR